MDAAVVNPGAILDHDTILLQSVNGTAHGPFLVLYSPAVSFIDCTWIAVALRIVDYVILRLVLISLWSN